MNKTSQLICAWCAIPFAIIFTIGLWPIAGMMPPLSPNLTALDIAEIYRENNLAIRTGALIMMSCVGFMCAFVAVIAVQMRRIEGRFDVLTIAQISGGTASVVAFVFATVAWTAAAFRPERSPELIQLLNDMGWIYFLMTFSTFIVQDFVVGFAILGDKNAEPIFPRWLGYFNLWVGVSFIPGGLLTFFKVGPFAWDGLFVWWIPFLMFFSWYIVMFVMLRRAIIAQSEQPVTS
ncbi:MAG: hypothetical protein ACI9BW_003432 [Gammaproteobacteria bacterium]|jgi:hypothetical protein